MGRKVNIAGQRFGRLIVVKELPRPLGGRPASYWLCLCDCGNTCEAYRDTIMGGKGSCGCLMQEKKATATKRESKRKSESEAVKKKGKTAWVKCPYPSPDCLKSKRGRCCYNCKDYESCEDKCQNTPDKCGYEAMMKEKELEKLDHE